MEYKNRGRVVRIVGPVIDIQFESEDMPAILNAIKIVDGSRVVWAEVSQHLEDRKVRCIALEATDGLKRGLEAYDTGMPITVPVGKEVLGRVFNVL